MIGKPEWFGPRKYTGWGISPRTWQGWAYILMICVLIGIVQILPIDPWFRVYAMFGVAIIFSIDFVHIALNIRKDERERVHEAFSERNAMWALLSVLIVGVGYQVAQSVSLKEVIVDPWLIAALVSAFVVKAVSNIYYDNKD